MQGFKRAPSALCVLETHAAVYSTFTFPRHLLSLSTVRILCARSKSVWSGAVS